VLNKKEKTYLPNLLAQIKSGKFHHAYLIKKLRDAEIEEVIKEIKGTLGKKLRSEDVFEEKIENLGIEDSRKLKERAQITALGEYKLFFLKISSMTREAENSLLKLLEEPPANSHFFIFAKSINLSKILLSRIVVIEGELDSSNTEVKKILEATIGEKIELAKKIADRVKEAESKDEIMDLLNTLEKEIVKKIGLTSKSSLVLKEVEEGKNFLKDKSASSKMILENIFIKIHELFKK
jgi:DNA polymerase III delta prime subunit